MDGRRDGGDERELRDAVRIVGYYNPRKCEQCGGVVIDLGDGDFMCNGHSSEDNNELSEPR